MRVVDGDAADLVVVGRGARVGALVGDQTQRDQKLPLVVLHVHVRPCTSHSVSQLDLKNGSETQY